MKFTIDTDSKTIELESEIMVSDLASNLKDILPDWEKYKIIPKYVNNNFWTHPYINPTPNINPTVIYKTDKPWSPNTPLPLDPTYDITMCNSKTEIN